MKTPDPSEKNTTEEVTPEFDTVPGSLFSNRKAFLRFNQFKKVRTLKTLSENDRQVFAVLPRLLHVNQPGLPGYLDDNVPCGIFNFELDRECQIYCEKLFPSVIIRRNENFHPVIHSVLLIGSVGTVAQTNKSDMDFTLLVDKSRFTGDSLRLFEKKLRLIEQWTWNEHKIETHFFVNDFHDVKNNNFGESDSESTGSALAQLLKEEMYRSLILIAGKIPFWWVVPVNTTDAAYDELLKQVDSGHTLLEGRDFIDIGNLDTISEGEFFGGSIWTLIKSFSSPFKQVMKMGLLENYMFQGARFNLLCHEVKLRVLFGKSCKDIDPYVLMFERVQGFFKDNKSADEVEALRTAFYMKVGTQISEKEFEEGSQDWKKSVLIEMLKQWGWTPAKLNQINSYHDWQMKQKVSMGNRINKILMDSYRNISEKCNTGTEKESLISERDTNLLGRKLFSFYRKAPNKVQNLFSLMDGETAEKELTFMFDQQTERGQGSWYLVRGRTVAFIEHVQPENVIKKAATFPFLIAFTAFNRLYRSSTNLLVRTEGHSIRDTDVRILLNQLSSFFSQVNIAAISNEDLLSKVRINKLYMIVDFGIPIPRDIVMGNINDCKTEEELAQFVKRRLERIRSVTTIFLTSWGELFCKTYSGLHSIDRGLSQLAPMIDPETVRNRNFLKVYIPSGRTEILMIPWLNNYLIRTLETSKMSHAEPVAG